MRRFVFIVLLAVLAPLAGADAQGSKAPTIVIALEDGGVVTLELWPDVAPMTQIARIALASSASDMAPRHISTATTPCSARSRAAWSTSTASGRVTTR